MTTKPTTEFDKVFKQLEALDYPATCDQCGAVGTNATMENHVCNESLVPQAGEWRTVGQVIPECDYKIAGMTVIQKSVSSELVALVRDREIAKRILTDHNQHATLVEQRDRLFMAAKFLLAMNATNYDRDAMRSEGGFDALQKAVDYAIEQSRDSATTIEQEGEA